MDAVILCAGRGRRLHPLTAELPKCLIPMGDITVLEYAVEALSRNGIEKIRLVTGFRRDKIEDLVSRKGYSNIRFTVNPDFDSTNTAYSLNLALKDQTNDFVLLNGDVLFFDRILGNLIDHPEENCIVVDRSIVLNEEEVKVVADNGRVLRIGKELDPEICLGEAVGINKISHRLAGRLAEVFQDLEKRKEHHHFFEKGFDILCRDHARFGMLATDLPWVEIDTPEDYRHAREEILPKILNG